MFVGIDVSVADSLSPASLVSLVLPQTHTHFSPKEGSESVQVEMWSGDDTLTENDDDSVTESEDDYSDEQKEVIMEFLNNSSQEELSDIPGCSTTKAKLLSQHLPVDKWQDLVRGNSESLNMIYGSG